MKRLDDLITFLKTKPLEMPNDKYDISDASREELIEELYKIKSECAELLRKDIPVDTQEEPHSQGGKLAVELGMPMNFRNWLFQGYHINAGNANDLPLLTMNYIYNKEIK